MPAPRSTIDPSLPVPQVKAPWVNNEVQILQYIELFHMIKHEHFFPEYIVTVKLEDFMGLRSDFFQQFIMVDLFTEWYDEFASFVEQNNLMHVVGYTKELLRKEQFQKIFLKVKDKYRDKVIKAGYAETNPTMGSLMDYNRAIWNFHPTLKT